MSESIKMPLAEPLAIRLVERLKISPAEVFHITYTELVEFQRQTLLAAAQHLKVAACGCDKVVERLADEAGRQK